MMKSMVLIGGRVGEERDGGSVARRRKTYIVGRLKGIKVVHCCLLVLDI